MDAGEYRRLMSCWTTGVSLVTSPGPDGPRGCTANSFTSLSLDPPSVLVCFDLSSRTLEAVRDSYIFAINILASDQEEVSRQFASKKSEAEKFAGVEHTFEEGAPVVVGCLAYLVCRYTNEFPGGDHAIVVGEITGGRINETADPLVFYHSRYGSLLATR